MGKIEFHKNQEECNYKIRFKQQENKWELILLE